MSTSPNIIQELICSDGMKLDISKSNEKSSVISVINRLKGNTSQERFYDTLLDDYNVFKLMTNPVIDMGKTDQGILYLFSSKFEKDPPEAIQSRLEHSTKCKYKLDPEIRNPSYDETFIEEKSKKIIFFSNEMYGYAIDDQISKGFSDKSKLLSLSDISNEVYENVINKCLFMGVGSVFQHICWCKKCISNTYAILLHGHNQIHDDIKCPICNEPLLKTKFMALMSDFEPLLEQKGGFIPPLIGWQLTRKGIEWTADVTMDQHEYADILFRWNDQYYLIESKIWSRQKNERSLTGNIKKAIDQAINHAKYWEERNVNIHNIAIVTNQFEEDTFRNCINNSLKEKAEQNHGKKIQIYPLMKIPKLLRQLLGE